MSSFYNTDNPDSLDVLLQKSRAVNTINKETLALISNSYEEHQTITATSTIQFPSPIEAWRYYGEHPQKEKIAFGDFIDVNFSTFDDLIRLVDDYNSLLEKYELTLKDVKESRLAVEVVLRNVEILQVAIGELHSLILDASLDPINSPKEFVDEKNKPFTNIEALKCKLTLPKQETRIESLDTFDANGKHYIIGENYIWDLNKNKVAARHPAYGDQIFFKDGVQMSVNIDGRTGKQVDLWNLSSRTKIVTLCDEDNYGSHGEINTLAIYENDGNPILLAGCDCGTILFWDLDTYEVDGIEGPEGVDSLYVFYRNSNPYVVCRRRFFRGYSDYDPIEIWDLTRKSIIESLDVPDETAFVSSIVMNHNDEPTLVLFGESGTIHIRKRSIESLKVCKSFDQFTKIGVEVLDCNGKQYLACPGDDATVIIVDIQNKKKVATLSSEAKVTAMKVFMNEDKPCLITGDDEGNIKLWME